VKRQLNKYQRTYLQVVLIHSAITLLPYGGCSRTQSTMDKKDAIPQFEKVGCITPKSSREIESSPWGIQAGTLREDLLEKASEIGVKWTRLGASWAKIETEKGQYNWLETDGAFKAATDAGITPFVTLGGGNPLYSAMTTYDDPKLAEIYGFRPEPPIKNPQAMKRWLLFVKATVNRYKDKIDYWEVWNEPNHRNYWGAQPNGKEYGQLLRQTATLIRKLDTDAKIIGGSMAGLSPEFTDDFLSVGTADLIDIISYHNYGPVPEERIYRAIEVWNVINKYDPELQLWQGECGYPSHSSTRDYRGSSPWGLNIQAKWLLRQSFTDTYFCKATLSNYFKLVHIGGRGQKQERSKLREIDKVMGYPQRPGGGRVRTKGVNEKCLLTNPDLRPKPGFFAYQNLCSLVDGRYEPIQLKYDIRIKDPGIFYGIGDEDDAFPSVPLLASYKTSEDNHLIAYWLPWKAQEYLPKLATVDILVRDVRFKNPVLVDLLSGNVYQLRNQVYVDEEIILRNLPLADYPIAIAERNQVHLN